MIEGFLRERADFILGALECTERTPFPPCEDGAALPWRGRTLTLALGRGSRSSARVEGGVLRLCVRDAQDSEGVRRALDRWYRAESEALCLEAFDRLYPQFAALGVPRPEIRMRAMRSCWGNCRPERRIVTFNALLAAAAPDCIEYVAAHELTHFLHADHSPAFYAALACVIPDWKLRRARLKALAPLLF